MVSKEDREVVSNHYKTMAANASASGAMMSGLDSDNDFSDVIYFARLADEAVQNFHDAIGCLTLQASIRKRNEQNDEDYELLRVTKAKLKQ